MIWRMSSMLTPTTLLDQFDSFCAVYQVNIELCWACQQIPPYGRKRFAASFFLCFLHFILRQRTSLRLFANEWHIIDWMDVVVQFYSFFTFCFSAKDKLQPADQRITQVRRKCTSATVSYLWAPKGCFVAWKLLAFCQDAFVSATRFELRKANEAFVLSWLPTSKSLSYLLRRRFKRALPVISKLTKQRQLLYYNYHQ